MEGRPADHRLGAMSDTVDVFVGCILGKTSRPLSNISGNLFVISLAPGQMTENRACVSEEGAVGKGEV